MTPPPTLDIEKLERLEKAVIAHANEERGHDGFTHEERIRHLTSSDCLDPRDAEITRLREALKAAEPIIYNEWRARDLAYAGRPELHKAMGDPIASCLALIRSALGTEGDRK